MVRRALALSFVWLVAAVVAPSSAGADQREAVPFRVIVNPSNPVTAVDHAFLLGAFLGKTTVWSGDQPIRPVDLRTESDTRRRFSGEVLRRSVSAVKSYWLQIVFSGRGVPPPELDSDDEVVKFVLRVPGAVGYVSGTARVDGVKIVEVR